MPWQSRLPPQPVCSVVNAVVLVLTLLGIAALSLLVGAFATLGARLVFGACA